MHTTTLNSLLCICVAFTLVSFSTGQNVYIVASVSHSIINQTSLSPAAITNKSLNYYEVDIVSAKQAGAQMVIFPEFGLGGIYDNRDSIYPFCIPSPKVGILPCNGSVAEYGDILYYTSCWAQSNEIIVVVNTCDSRNCSADSDPNCPSDGRYQYNTELVFDERGVLIAVYHKSHPYHIFCFDKPDPFDVVTFNTSFGVTFGVFVCLDIAYSEPADALSKQGVRHIAYSASIPTVVAEETFIGWSVLHDSNLVVSNLEGVAGVFSSGKHLDSKQVDVGNGDSLVLTPVTY